MNQTSILLLDEITSALDGHSSREIEKLIQFINEKYKTTIIWITHNLTQAASIGHYVWVLNDGKLIESGPIQLLANSENPIVQQFVKGDLR